MSKKLIKTLFTPAFLVLISVLSVFSASATADEAPTMSIKSRMSTNDEQINEVVTEPQATIPTMKPSYITAPGVVYSVEEEYEVQEATIEEPTMENIPNATHVKGATSVISSEDLATPEEATVDTVSSGVVHTSDSSMSVLILVGLSALCCVVIGIHKKNLTE